MNTQPFNSDFRPRRVATNNRLLGEVLSCESVMRVRLASGDIVNVPGTELPGSEVAILCTDIERGTNKLLGYEGYELESSPTDVNPFTRRSTDGPSGLNGNPSRLEVKADLKPKTAKQKITDWATK